MLRDRAGGALPGPRLRQDLVPEREGPEHLCAVEYAVDVQVGLAGDVLERLDREFDRRRLRRAPRLLDGDEQVADRRGFTLSRTARSMAV